MNASHAYNRLLRLGLPVIATADAAAALGQTAFAASKTLQRLAEAGLIDHIRRGSWRIDRAADLYCVGGYLTHPLPSYLSLQTALYHHGMIEQVPVPIYLVSLARTQRIRTSLGLFSIHHVAPPLFGGFVEKATHRIATPEKALFDLAYLSGTRSRWFSSLPELELPEGFRHAALRKWIRTIPSKRGRTLVEHRLATWLK